MKNKSEIRISKVTNLFANTQIKNRKIKILISDVKQPKLLEYKAPKMTKYKIKTEN